MKKTVLALLVILLIAQTRPAVAGPPLPNFAIPDGEWLGSMFAQYFWDVADVTGFWKLDGEMHFTSAAGELTGESAISGSASAERDSAYGIGTLSTGVAIFGSSFAPEFQAMSGSMEITATVQGFTSTITLPIEPSGTSPVPVRLITVTCNQVSGEWDDYMNQYASSVGMTLSGLTTIWAAVRTADLAPEAQQSYYDALQSLMDQANTFLNDTKTNQALDKNAFKSVLTKAEELALSLRKNNDCGFTSPWTYALPVASLVAQIIDFAFNNPGYFTNYDVYLLTEAAIETGVIGAGAVNTELDTQMRSKLGALIGVKLDDLDAAGGGCPALTPLWVASGWIGGPAQTQASGLSTKYGC